MRSPLAAAGKPHVPARLAVSRALLLAILAACHDRAAGTAPPEPPPHDRELRLLRAFEQERRAATDFATLPPSDVAFGPDPYRIAPLHGGERMVGLLRGESAVVLLDRDGAELARVAAPRSPSGLAVSGDDDVLVVGEAARELAHYRITGGVTGGRLERVATLPIDALGMRAVALAPDERTAYIVEDHDGRLLAVPLEREPSRAFRRSEVRELGRCHGPYQVEAAAGHVAVNCVLDHAIEIRRDHGELARIHHDGPLWSFALRHEPDGGLLIAAGGIEDHPLEREDGGFGYIDSYLYLYRLAPGAAQPQRLAAVNSSALDVVTPKWVAIRGDAGTLSIVAAGYASPTLLTLTWRGGEFAAAPTVERAELLPGTSAAQLAGDGALVAANPLFDAWVVRRGGPPRLVPVASTRPARPVLSRIGELLFFTTMMSPWNSAEGKLSRFTCETCHHEGYVDGRTHFTGRGDVHATTRPLYGLFNNRPHFSRALDKTTTQMVHAEFRVANRHNGRDPWFSLSRADVPWLEHVAGAPAQLPPELLREAFMSFLLDFTHRANPAAIDHTRFTDRERAGAQVFRDRCASCHAARLVADEPGSLVPFERWESLVLSPSGPIVWSDASYQKTGVEPYVNERGARVPALRRLYKKWPYFTNGSARSLAELLDRFAWSADAAYHDRAPANAALTRLTPDDKATLLAFLDLL
ncbi:MAG TPA: c-type cytochrome [Kofleriaceae bacterium]|nr:c-type cytochrome [Kofleriaceae bacterium]